MKKTIQYLILRHLVENNHSILSIREISKLIKKDYKNTSEAIKTLPSISIKKAAGANQVSFNFQFSEILFQIEFSRRQEILSDKNLRIIMNDISKINSLFIMLLFGSRAKKTQHKKSDYDLLLITDTPTKIEETLSLYPVELHVHTISLQEFKRMALSKELTVVSEAIKNNIILWGIEEYYRILNNAK